MWVDGSVLYGERCDIRPVFGATYTDKFLWANAWRQFGKEVDSPMPGDVLTFRWSNGFNHVALYDHETPGDQYAVVAATSQTQLT